MDAIITYQYNDYPISFDFGNEQKMINATQMVKAFPNKRINDFTKSKQTNSFIAALEIRSGNSRHEIIRIVQSGNAKLQGTWMHEKLALKFAAWLSPDFELWVYDKIHELLTKGSTSLKPMSQAEFAVYSAQKHLEHEQKLLEHDERLDSIEARISTKNEAYYTISGYASLIGYQVGKLEAQLLGKKATTLSRQQNIMIDKEYDAKYGQINSYHISILKRILPKA